MSCIKDAQKAILDKAFEYAINGRPTFKRVGLNQFEMSQGGKNKSNAQARAIAISTIKRISQYFNGHISGTIEQRDEYSPVTVNLRVNPSYVEYVFNNQIKSQDKSVVEQGTLFSLGTEEQDQINANTGVDTDADLNPKDEFANPAVGYFTKFIQHKEQILEDYETRLKNVQKELNSKDITPERLKELNKVKRTLTNEINGVIELNKKGLKQEIRELRTKANTLAVGYYVEKDLSRLEELSQSDDIDELNEAKRIIDFYDLAGTFQEDIDNPFFDKEDMFLKDENDNITSHYKISEEDRNQFIEWKNRAIANKNIVTKKFKEIAERVVNEDISVKATYGNKQLSFEDITLDGKGLKDTNWIDMWVMDVTNGIFSKNGLLPQVMFSQIANSITQEKQYATHFEERVNEINPTVLEKLKKLGQTLKSKGIDGITQGVYSIFLEKNHNNQLTGGYSYKFNNDYQNEKAKAYNQFQEDFNNAKLIEDYQERKTAFKEAFKNYRNWNRNNNILIEFNKIPEIINDTEFAEYEEHFDRVNSNDYKAKIVAVIGEKEYNKQVKEQKRLLRKYVADKQDMVDTLMEEQGITNPKDLSEENKLALSRWTKANSPFYGINDYYEVNFDDGNTAGNYQNYNLFIPRKNKVAVSLSEDNRRYYFEDTNDKTNQNFYNKDFEDYIEKDEDLYKFHELLSEAMDYVKSVASPELAKDMAFNYLSTLDKTSAEVITDKNNEHNILLRVIPAFKNMWERLRLSFGVVKQNNISYETIDPITGKTNYKVNDSFLRDNKRAIEDKNYIEQVKFLQAFNVDAKNKISDLKKFTTRKLSDFNISSLVLLTDYLGVEISLEDIKRGKIKPIEDRVGKDVQIGKVIRDYSTHEIIKEQSFDLAKIIKHFTNMAALYSARTQAKPKLDLLKKYYENISETKTNNVGEPIFNIPNGKNEIEGNRDNAIRQMNSWYERVVLDNHGNKHKGVFGSENKKEALIGKTIFSKEDREKFNEIEELLGDGEKNIDKVKSRISEINSELENEDVPNRAELAKEKITAIQRLKLLKIQEKLGKTRTATALIENMFNWVRTLRLGWNVSSAVTNMVEGYISNMIIAATGEYFNSNEIYYAYNVAKHSFIKNLSFGKVETGLAKKNRMLMDMFDVLMDSKNELQKSSVKTFSDKFEKFNPHAIGQRVEYINQSAIMIAMLRSTKIKDKNGVESSIWDAYDNKANRKLKEEFRTEENIKNWEDLIGDTFKITKEKLRKAIVLGHGNYDELRGMMSKTNTAGKALMMFKTWLPQQIYWRIATQQDDIQSGTIGFKGKYWSYGVGSGALHGAAVGTALGGPLGTAIGGAIGGTFGFFARQNLNKDAIGDDSIGLLKETLISAKVLAKKMIGMPLNTLTGRVIIDTSGKEINTFVGKGGFTQQDANALKANMSDIALQLTWLALILLTKAMFWDDDDDQDSKERIAHNILVNKLMQLSSQSSMYINPVEGHKSSIGSIAIIAYLSDVSKTVYAVNEALHGKDEIKSGINAGESKLWNQSKKTLLPGIFKSNLLGFESLSERQFNPSPLDKYFKLNITDKRKEMKADLESKGASKKEIKEQLDRELPTKKLLHKKGMTREEWLKQNSDSN